MCRNGRSANRILRSPYQPPAYDFEDRYALHVLNCLLGGGMSSRLFRELREERGLVYQVQSELHTYRAGGLWVIEGATTPDRLMATLVACLIQLGRLMDAETPVDDEETWKAKMQMRGQHLLAADSMHTRMSRLATQQFYFGRHIAEPEIVSQIDRVDASSLQSLAERLLAWALPQASLAVLGPRLPLNDPERELEGLVREICGHQPESKNSDFSGKPPANVT